MRSPIFWRLGIAISFLGAAPMFLRAAEPAGVGETYYYDETQMRHLRLKTTGVGATEVEVRFASEPGSANRWMGSGQRQDKDLSFARVVGEGEDRGTFFVADISESKVVVRYKPNQTKTEDAGILGTYHRASETKRMQLAKKEVQGANERLIASLKAAPKAWDSKDRPALALWKESWPSLRQRWMEVNFSAPGPAKQSAPKSAFAPKEPAGAAAEKAPDYWFKMAEATWHGYAFVEAHPDPKTGLDWNGEYDDFAGGHVSLRVEKDGKLRMGLFFSRAPEDTASGAIDAVTPAAKLTQAKDGTLKADFIYTVVNVDPEADAAVNAKAKAAAEANPTFIHLTKIGHYLKVETEHAEKNMKRGWFDGIYRGAPPPPE